MGDLQKVLDGEYALPEDFDPGPAPVVLDIGANVGCYSLYAAHEYSGAKIYAYEPVPDNYALLEKNVEGLNVEVHRTAVSDVDGTTRIFAPKEEYFHGCWSIKDIGEQSDKSKGGICKVIHAANLPPADIIKIDTEGCEWEILSNYPHLAAAKAVVLEWHSYADRQRIRDFMLANQFLVVQDTEWSWKSGGRGVAKFVKAHHPLLFIAVLAGGGKTWASFESSLAELQRVAPQHGISLIIHKESGTGVDRARNRCVEAALTVPEVTHFMFFDDDITFDPMWVVNMVRTNLDVVGAAYPRKQIDWPMIEKAVKDGVTGDDLRHYATSFIFNFIVDNGRDAPNGRHFDGIGDFVEVEEIGTGFLMCKRSVLDKMIAAYKDEISYVTDYPPKDVIHHMVFACGPDPRCELEQAKTAVLAAAAKAEDDVGKLQDAAIKYRAALEKGQSALGRYLTEDYRWCRMWRMLGGKIFMYVDAAVGHIGFMEFEGQVKRQFKKVEVETNG